MPNKNMQIPTSKCLAYAAGLVLVFSFTHSAFAATTVSDNFDSYRYGPLNGDNGGMGWTTPWTKDSQYGDYSVDEIISGLSGLQIYASTTLGSVQYTRSFNGMTSGTGSIWAYLGTSTPNGIHQVSLQEGSTTKMAVYFDSDGHIKELYGASEIADLGAYSANTPYTIEFKFNNTTHPGKYRVSINAEKYTRWRSVINGSYSSIDTLGLETTFSSKGGLSGIGAWDDVNIKGR